MMRDEKTLIDYHYKRNPELKTMIDNLDQFAMDEIEQCTLPKWMRLYLLKSKQAAMRAVEYEEMSGKVLAHATYGFQIDKPGKIIRWVGSECFIKFGNSHLLVKPNDLLFAASDGLWLDTVFTRVIDPNLNQYVFVQDSTFWDYKLFRKSDLLKRTPEVDSLPLIGEPQETPLSRAGVRFYKV